MAWLRDTVAEQCRRSFATFFCRGWSVIEGSTLHWNWHLQAQCDTAQAFAEGWLVAHGKGTAAMVERQRGYWRRHGREMLEGELLVDHLVANGGPITCKSRIWMVFLQGWVWLHDPTAAFACTSGTGKNVTRDSVHAKDLVSSPWYRETFRPAWRVGVTSTGQIVDSVEKWVNSAGGERVSIPWLSSWSGIHADFLLGDDADDAHKVWSESARDEVREKHDRAMGNRKKMKSVELQLQQHVHANDLTSNLKLRGVPDGDREAVSRAKSCGAWDIDHRKRWAAFVLPVEFNPRKRCTTPWGWTDPRSELGEVLFDLQFTREYIDAERERLGPTGWAAQGNQDPENIEGGEVKRAWWRFFVVEGESAPFRQRPQGCRPRHGDDAEPAVVLKRKANGRLDLDWCVLSVDPKNESMAATSSRVGAVVIGGKGNQRFILDDRTARLGFLATIDLVGEIIVDWAPELTANALCGVLIEAKAQGPAATRTLRRDIAAAKIKDRNGRPIVVPILEVEGGNEKFEDRFNAALPSFRSGLVLMLDGASFAEEHIDEVCGVPNGAFDDRADADCQAINHFAVRRARPAPYFGGIMTTEDFPSPSAEA